LSDSYAQVADEFGLLNAERIREVWAGASHARRQVELDRSTRAYRQLAARTRVPQRVQ
jgi:hypothetical protein